jgi:KaiC/GvpD/RAD55 family RecA-like ATPase
VNLGRVMITRVLTGGDISTLIAGGFTYSWLMSSDSGSGVIFPDIDKRVYKYLLQYYQKYRSTPSLEYFRSEYPEEVYSLSTDCTTPLEVCQALAAEKINSFLLAEAIGRAIDLHDSGNVPEAVSYLASESARIAGSLKAKSDRADTLGDSSFNLEEMLDRQVSPGVPLGVGPVDEVFWGFQPGQLITLLGRQKAGKTTFMLNSALSAWENGYDVLFFSVEMDTEILRQRLYSLGAGVSPSRFRRGALHETEKQRVRKFHDRMTSAEDVSFRVSRKKSMITVADVIAEINLYHPHVIYIDGFNFMLDSGTHRTTEDWQANEAVAAELKSLALEEEIAIVVATQVQEKQYHAKSGIEARSIMGGTGLLKASDLVIGLNKADGMHEISCVLSRYEYFDLTSVIIDWNNMMIEVLEEEKADYTGRGI